MRGAVAAGHPLTAEAGARVLEEGGNAVDACVAAAFAAWVAESPLTGPGAGGFALVVPRDGRPARVADFFVATPGLGRPGAGGGRDARDRRRLRRRQRDDSGLPHRRGLVRRARRRRRARGGPSRVRAAAVARVCSSRRSSSRETGVVLTRPQAHLHAILDLILRHATEGRRVYSRADGVAARPRRHAAAARPRRHARAARRRRAQRRSTAASSLARSCETVRDGGGRRSPSGTSRTTASSGGARCGAPTSATR